MESKPWYLSTTIWSSIVALIGLAAPKAIAWLGGTDAATNDAVNVSGAVVTLIGIIGTIYGRVKANKTIGTPTPPVQ